MYLNTQPLCSAPYHHTRKRLYKIEFLNNFLKWVPTIISWPHKQHRNMPLIFSMYVVHYTLFCWTSYTALYKLENLRSKQLNTNSVQFSQEYIAIYKTKETQYNTNYTGIILQYIIKVFFIIPHTFQTTSEIYILHTL